MTNKKESKVKVKKTLIWSILNNKYHPTLNEEDKKIISFMPLVEGLFPGIDYYSITGYGQVQENYVTPVLKKLFPDLKGLDSKKINQNEQIEITPFLPSKGYEHLEPKWRKKLEKLLAE